jgi:YegS/Rv2252/BmrU family lipid kinase
MRFEPTKVTLENIVAPTPKSPSVEQTAFDRAAVLRQHNEPVNLLPRANLDSLDLLLANPAAGGGRAAAILSDLKAFADSHGWKVKICLTESPSDLTIRARQAAETGHSRIFVLGGDGTFQVLLNAVADYPRTIVGMIPAGGGNDLAVALGLPNDPIRATALLLDGEVCSLDAARVRTADGVERLYVGGGGVGLDGQSAQYANGAFKNLPGRLRYLLAAIRALVGFHAIRARITMTPGEQEQLQATALIVAVLNTPSYGAGLYLAPGAKTDDGKLDIVIVENLSLIQILALLPALALRGELNTKRIRRFRVQCVRIETESPCWFHGDGELLGMTPVEISVVPRAIQVLRPARNVATSDSP